MAWNTTSLQRSIAGQAWFKAWFYGTRHDWNATWQTHLSRDPLMRNVVMVFDLVLGGGKRLRLATRSIEVVFSDPSGAGVVERFSTLPLLNEEPDIDFSYKLGEGSSSSRSYTITVATLGFNPWELIIRYGKMLAGAGEVSLIGEGMDWNARLVVMRGDMAGGTSFGATKEGMSMSVGDPKLTADLGITEHVTSLERFADLPESSVGQRYPLAMNAPTGCSLTRLTVTTPPTFLVCYGHTHGAAAVYVDGVAYASGSADYPWGVQYLFDAYGTPYTGLVFSAGVGVWTDSTSVYADLEPHGSEQEQDVVTTIGRLVSEWSLLGPESTGAALFARAQAKLATRSAPGIYINGSGDSDATGALSYIESTICGAFPMLSMAWQIGGYAPVLTDRRREAVAKWVVGQGVIQKRSSEWEEAPKSDILNWFTVKYGYDAIGDTYAGVVERNPNNSLLCQISEQQAGPRVADPIESVLLTDPSEAEWVADWLVAHKAIPSYGVEHPIAPAALVKYRLGDNIDLVDEEIFGCTFTNPVRATIEGFVYKRGECAVRLRLWPLFANIPAAQSPVSGYAGSGAGGGN